MCISSIQRRHRSLPCIQFHGSMTCLNLTNVKTNRGGKWIGVYTASCVWPRHLLAAAIDRVHSCREARKVVSEKGSYVCAALRNLYFASTFRKTKQHPLDLFETSCKTLVARLSQYLGCAFCPPFSKALSRELQLNGYLGKCQYSRNRIL